MSESKQRHQERKGQTANACVTCSYSEFPQQPSLSVIERQCKTTDCCTEKTTMPSTGNWVMAIVSLKSQLTSIYLCQGCLARWPRPCFKMRKHHRGSQNGLLRGLDCPGRQYRWLHGESDPHSPPAQKAPPHSPTSHPLLPVFLNNQWYAGADLTHASPVRDDC